MLDPNKVSKSICRIESEICFLHGLLAAEERGVSALQTTNKQSPKSGRSHRRCIHSLNGKRGYHKKCSTCYPRYANFKAA